MSVASRLSNALKGANQLEHYVDTPTPSWRLKHWLYARSVTGLKRSSERMGNTRLN